MRYGRGHKELVPLHLNLAAIDTISQKIQNEEEEEEEEGIIKSMALALEYTLLRNQIVEMLVVVVVIVVVIVIVIGSVRDDIIDVM